MYLTYGESTIYMNPGMLLLIPALILTIVAQAKVSSAYSRYSQVYCMSGITGANAAERILWANGINYVNIYSVGGRLSDHFDPRERAIRLSEGVYNRASIAAVAIAAHEAGHAIQYETGYKPLAFRNALAPVVNFANRMVIPIVILGAVMGMMQLIYAAAIVFGVILLFQLVTLPVEFDASRRALTALETSGVLVGEELRGAKKVLNAAALTYVAATIVTLAQFMRFFGMAQRRR